MLTRGNEMLIRFYAFLNYKLYESRNQSQNSIYYGN